MDNISLIYDKTGFPLIEIKKMNLFVHALPVTKIQFEKFISDSNTTDFTDLWYENILKSNPRGSYRKFTDKNYWNLFMTGIYPEEADKFAEYLGRDYRIPTIGEWREIYRYFNEDFRPVNSAVLLSEVKTDKILSILEGIKKLLGKDLFSMTLMRKGIAEWVKEKDERYVGIGKVDPNFWPNALDPMYDVIKPIGEGEKRERIDYIGCRLVKDIKK